MTNFERYEFEIEYGINISNDFCVNFIIPKVLKPKSFTCSDMVCATCNKLFVEWLLEEYKEHEIDWSKVEVDTKIYVKNHEDDNEWYPRYFAKYENGKVYAWEAGGTSWSNEPDDVTDWKYAKLAEV